MRLNIKYMGTRDQKCANWNRVVMHIIRTIFLIYSARYRRQVKMQLVVHLPLMNDSICCKTRFNRT